MRIGDKVSNFVQQFIEEIEEESGVYSEDQFDNIMDDICPQIKNILETYEFPEHIPSPIINQFKYKNQD